MYYRNLTVGSYVSYAPYMSGANNIVQFIIISPEVSNMTALYARKTYPRPCYFLHDLSAGWTMIHQHNIPRNILY
jgi:hypothetical protein